MNNKKIFYALLIGTIILLIGLMPISYGSFADFTDEQADKQAQEQIKEQAEHNNVTQIKSTDNYLESLQVEGYTLAPEFDKQTLEYTIKEDVIASPINIKTKTSSEKASVSGNGLVQLEKNKKEYRIDVTAESGTVRTYIIKINEDKTVDTNSSMQIDENTNKDIIDAEQKDQNIEQSNNESKTDNYYLYIIIIITIIIIGLIMFFIMKSKKKGKH